ncbi:MAG: AAA family ATPase [Actinomycetota bacterium]
MQEGDIELELGDYVSLFRRRWRWVAGTMLVVVGLVAAVSLSRDKSYDATARVLVLTEQSEGVFNTRQDDLHRVAFAEVAFLSTDAFDRIVTEDLGRSPDFSVETATLAPGEDIEDASVLVITASAPTGERAAADANGVAATYLRERVQRDIDAAERTRVGLIATRDDAVAERQTLFDQIAAAASAVEAATTPAEASAAQLEFDSVNLELTEAINNLSSRIGSFNSEIDAQNALLDDLAADESTGRLLSAARVPADPVSPNIPRNVLVAIVVSMVFGAVLAVMRDLLDTRAHDGAELARLVDIPVMATIGEIRSQRSAPGNIRRFGDLSLEESSGYHVLLNSLWLSNVNSPMQSIVFSSDRSGVGKTQTVVNLAQAEAARGTRVLVIDTDFVNPSVLSRLGLDPAEVGLGDLLSGTASFESVVMASEMPTLHVIDAKGAGGVDLLRSERLSTLLTGLYDTYDLILIDSMPTLSAADSRLVASQADAAVVVYDPAESRREELQHTIDLLRGSGANLIGLVANRSRATHPVYLSVGGK